uniref:Uncharacterized protein n=1 Tax=Anguilla anguilla TaxID=7936 RepID=A0A0E9TBX4_ANGAN
MALHYKYKSYSFAEQAGSIL